nr:efflux RND transporter periplasmic adaptor subunit [Ameyamaea chiangmaiensis]
MILLAPHTPARADDWPTAPITIATSALSVQGIETATSHAGAIAAHVDAPGYVTVDERRVVRVRPVGTGRVEEVLVTPGQSVRRGQVLLTYDDFSLSDETQRLASAEAALQQARATARQAELSYGRARSLQGGAVSVGEMQRRQSLLLDAQGMVQTREAVVRNERERMARFSSATERSRGVRSDVVSPIDGIVRRVSVSAGEDVSSGAVAPVEVDDLSHLWVVSQVDELDTAGLAPGNRQQTWVRPDLPPLVSRIDLIEGGVDPGSRHVLVRSLVPNADLSLRAGQLVQTRLFAGRKVAGQIVPTTALQTIAGQACVFVRIGAEQYVARKITPGPALNGEMVVTQGLADHETVVTKGSFVLKSQALLAPPSDHTQPG